MRWCLTETKKLKQEGYVLASKCFKRFLKIKVKKKSTEDSNHIPE